jgi:hypothetical protein
MPLLELAPYSGQETEIGGRERDYIYNIRSTIISDAGKRNHTMRQVECLHVIVRTVDEGWQSCQLSQDCMALSMQTPLSQGQRTNRLSLRVGGEMLET